MSLRDAIGEIAADLSLELREKGGVFSLEKIVAERKAFLTRKKLVYSARIALDEGKKELVFTESLKETGFGLSMDSDPDMTPGFGFKAETYKTRAGPREGTIEEQSNLFGKTYNYSFDFANIRGRFAALAERAGYAFRYKIF
ncbi:MAG: hypothetical protein HZA02_11045 [Nitrospinae bacterium]|nr:hypothetical protein [Nitrospinota bacterium]